MTPKYVVGVDESGCGALIGPLVVVAVFQSIFSGAKPLMDGVENAVASSGNWIGAALPDGLLRGFLIEGIWAGVGSVLIFLPQILLLFLFIAHSYFAHDDRYRLLGDAVFFVPVLVLLF